MATYSIFKNKAGQLRAVKQGTWLNPFRLSRFFLSEGWIILLILVLLPVFAVITLLSFLCGRSARKERKQERELLDNGFVYVATIGGVDSTQSALIHYQALLNQEKRNGQKKRNPTVSNPFSEECPGYKYTIFPYEYSIFEHANGDLQAAKEGGLIGGEWDKERLLSQGYVQIASIDSDSERSALIHYRARIRRQQRPRKNRRIPAFLKDPDFYPTYSATYRFINRDYTIFQHPNGKLQAIKKTGWNGWAFLFDGLWALVKGLYGRFVLMVCVYLFLAVLVLSGEAAGYEGNFDKMAYFLIFIMKFIYALNATKWVEQKWIRKDYQRKEILQADSRRDAIHRHQKMTEKGASES